MALRSIGPRIATMPQRIARPARDTAEASRARDNDLAYRAWYKTARWRRQRLAVIWRDAVICAMCGKQSHGAAQFIRAARMAGQDLNTVSVRDEFTRILTADPLVWVADHITPHRGDEAMFWDIGNAQCLCKRCHDRDKQREEARDRRQW